ncbi:hypothetical protein [Hyalangium rubrum]|uniref:Lipoprotein n=1 Tax=Hyalangium rubrum TaxID=3103134 RepID=A0ABU5H9P2_9BACT|nr:hypothetical protein [Hyalangium sp. s54d21]MDY7229809.1 hypothetical protein [Hyalangium sp. s54d21]
MTHGFRGGAVLALGLLGACATGQREVRDEGLARIEESMRPEAHPDVIPEGISLGLDAPPLALPEPEVAQRAWVDSSETAFPAPGSGYWVAPWVFPAPVFGPNPGTVRFHIEARPGGTIPGLLP